MSLLGYRWWHAGYRPGEGWRLRSLWQKPPRPLWWAGPHLTALRPPRVLCPSNCWNALRLRCVCGIYAFCSRERAQRELPPLSEWHAVWGDYTVLGEVSLWGKVVAHEDGYRAEHAMVRRLVVPMRLRIATPLAPPFERLLEISDEEQTPDPGMAESLARRYAVDVEFGQPVTCDASP